MTFSFGDYVLDVDRRELCRARQPVALEPQVFDLLVYLIRNRKRVVSKDDLIESIWGGRIVSESAVTSRLNAARKAIGDSGAEQRLIRTFPRKGVRFVGVVLEAEGRGEDAGATAPVGESRPMEPPVPVPDRTPTAERRQMTVVACELLPGTGIARMDPEDLLDAADAYRCWVKDTANRFKGVVGASMGKTVLIHFGYPAAREDDAEQAVLAGLALCADAHAEYIEPRPDRQPRPRIGIATGQVIIGDTSKSRVPAPVGHAPSIAAQLQNSASPGTVLIDSATRQLIGGLFNCREIEAIPTPGTVELPPAWQVLGACSIESRFEALRPAALTPLVGREEEVDLLLRRWTRAKSGEGHVVLISGEPGIGKSRLTATLLERIAAEPHTRLRYFSSPRNTDNALYPIIRQLERAAGLAHDDKPHAKLDKLDSVLSRTSTSIQDAALLAEMLTLPNDGRYPALALAPEQRRQRTLEALTAQLAESAGQQPVLMIFEDVHWIDPTSLEAINRTVDRIKTLPVLLVVTFRPEFNAPWVGQSHVTSLTLNRLGEREAAAIVARLAGNRELPANLMAEIVERTDGIPLFVEEMTKAVLDTDSEGAAGRADAAVPCPALVVPTSLHASLMARLDRLGPAKEVARVGAAIGREFPHALLASVMRDTEPELGSALDRLIQAGLLFRQGVQPHASYLFKHALVQDAAYGTLLREQRRALHARIAETLENQFTEIAGSRPDLLAHHCTEAGLTEKAAGLWGKAGQQSLARSALVEAVAQLTRALDQIATLPSTPALRREQIRLQVALGNALMFTKGYAAPESKAAFDRARSLIDQAEALGEAPEDPLLPFSVLYGFWVANYLAFNGDVVCGLAARFLRGRLETCRWGVETARVDGI